MCPRILWHPLNPALCARRIARPVDSPLELGVCVCVGLLNWGPLSREEGKGHWEDGHKVPCSPEALSLPTLLFQLCSFLVLGSQTHHVWSSFGLCEGGPFFHRVLWGQSRWLLVFKTLSAQGVTGMSRVLLGSLSSASAGAMVSSHQLEVTVGCHWPCFFCALS